MNNWLGIYSVWTQFYYIHLVKIIATILCIAQMPRNLLAYKQSHLHNSFPLILLASYLTTVVGFGWLEASLILKNLLSYIYITTYDASLMVVIYSILLSGLLMTFVIFILLSHLLLPLTLVPGTSYLMSLPTLFLW